MGGRRGRLGPIVVRDGRIAVGDFARAFRMFGILGLFGDLDPLGYLDFLGVLGTPGASSGSCCGIFARDFAGVTGGSGFGASGATIAEGASHHRRLRKLAGFRHSARRHPRAGRHAHTLPRLPNENPRLPCAKLPGLRQTTTQRGRQRRERSRFQPKTRWQYGGSGRCVCARGHGHLSQMGLRPSPAAGPAPGNPARLLVSEASPSER